MHVLIVDSEHARREQLIEVMAWFGAVEAVHQADRMAAIAAIARRTPVDVVIVGEVDDAPQGDVLGAARRLFPDARLVGFNALDPAICAMLYDAGAEVVFDRRMSSWKMALALRPLFWTEAPVLLHENTSGAYSLY